MINVTGAHVCSWTMRSARETIDDKIDNKAECYQSELGESVPCEHRAITFVGKCELETEGMGDRVYGRQSVWETEGRERRREREIKGKDEREGERGE